MDLNTVMSILGPSLRTGLPGFIGLTVAIENGFLFVYQQLESYVVRRPKGWDKPKRYRGPRIGLGLDHVEGDTWKQGEEEEEEIEMVDVTLHRLNFAVRHCADLDALRAAQEDSQSKREEILEWDRTRRKRGGGMEHGIGIGDGDYLAGGEL